MTFDDEEHRVKRILDAEPASEQNVSHGKNSQSNALPDTPENVNEAQNEDSIKNQDTLESTDFENTVSDAFKAKMQEKDNTTQDEKEVPIYDEDISKNLRAENLEDNFYNSNEEVYKSPADKLREEEEEHRRNKPKATHMGVLDHLGELRRRLTRIVIFILIGFFAFYGISELAYAYLAAPLTSQLPEGSKLIYTSPQGAFFTYLKVSFMLSILGTSPLTFYQLWAFIAPGLYKEEQRAIMPLAFFSAFFFISGAAFCYFLVFPIAFHFFLGFTSDMIIPMISVEEYLSFALKLVIAFGLVFEMPLFSYFLAKLRIITPEAMRRQRKYAILFIFIFAAMLTPPDVFSQSLMALPMLFLYEVSIYVAKVARGLSDAKQGASENTEDDNTEDTTVDTMNNSGTSRSEENFAGTKETDNLFSEKNETDLSKLSDEELAQKINNFK